MMDWDKLWAFNRKVIDPIVPRHTALLKDHMVILHLDGATEGIKLVDKHPKVVGWQSKCSSLVLLTCVIYDII